MRVEGTKELEDALVDALNSALANNKLVLWLIPGGSNIVTAIKVMDRIESGDMSKLTIALTDERFGEPGHKDSNFYQLSQGGFKTRGAVFIDLLKGGSFLDTIKASGEEMKKIFTYAEELIGFFGIGSDGHIAGILPHSPAAVSDEAWMIGYDAGQFKRVTLTPFAISHVRTAFIGAYGPEKLDALTILQDKMLPVEEQPAQILKHLPEAFIYNNQLGERP